MKSLKVEIANICGKITSENEEFIRRIDLGYRNFLSTKEEDFIFRVNSNFQPIPIHSHLDSPSYLEQNVILVPRNGRYSFVLDKDREISVGSMDIGKGKAQLYRLPGQEVGSYFDLLLMHAVRLFLAYNKGFFLHSCGLIKDDRAFIFAGPDGSGKSTISKLLPGVFTASDDSLAVKKTNGFHCLYTTPWGSRKTINTSAQIAKIFFLRKAHRLRMERMRPAEAAREFLANIFFNTSDNQIYQKTLETIDNLIKEISCYKLYFSRQESNLDRIFNF